MPHVGEQIGPYTLIKKIGRGAFGSVWLAERRTIIATMTVAIKLALDDDVDLEAVREEASIWIQASGHPNILPIIEANVYSGLTVIASEYAPDGSLDSWIKEKHNSLNVDASISLMFGVLAGLEHLHNRKIIHRDLKPANILLQGSCPRLADFGISRVLKSTSQSMTIAGTPAYMAPEAFEGKRNEQTDIWSAGVILYELLNDRLPFPGIDQYSVMHAILTKEPARCSEKVNACLNEVVQCALSKDRNRRFQSVAEMRNALAKASTRDLAQQSEESRQDLDEARQARKIPPRFEESLSDAERRRHNDARRFARLLVSEIKLYNERTVDQGYANYNIYDVLREEIDRSWGIYKKRVGDDFAARYDYFHEEIEQTLAAGEVTRLGRNYLSKTDPITVLKHDL